MHRSIFILALAMLSAPSPLAAQAPPVSAPESEREYECRHAVGEIKIDGVGDDEAWKHAAVIDDFVVGWAKEGPQPARSKTRAKLLWNERGFYFLAEMEDADLFADITKHDGETWLDDVFEIFFKPDADKYPYYEFEINARNTVFDLFLPVNEPDNVRRYLEHHTFRLETAVRLRGTLNMRQDRDEGWSVEGLIPWSDLKRTGGAPRANDRWRFTLCRYDYSVYYGSPELSSIARFKAPDFHRTEDYPWVRFIGRK